MRDDKEHTSSLEYCIRGRDLHHIHKEVLECLLNISIKLELFEMNYAFEPEVLNWWFSVGLASSVGIGLGSWGLN
jgi:hypothetical protein